MAQIKIYGLAERLDPIKARLSELLHTAAMTAFELPPDKRFHRFLPLHAAHQLGHPRQAGRCARSERSGGGVAC